LVCGKNEWRNNVNLKINSLSNTYYRKRYKNTAIILLMAKDNYFLVITLLVKVCSVSVLRLELPIFAGNLRIILVVRKLAPWYPIEKLDLNPVG